MLRWAEYLLRFDLVVVTKIGMVIGVEQFLCSIAGGLTTGNLLEAFAACLFKGLGMVNVSDSFLTLTFPGRLLAKYRESNPFRKLERAVHPCVTYPPMQSSGPLLVRYCHTTLGDGPIM